MNANFCKLTEVNNLLWGTSIVFCLIKKYIYNKLVYSILNIMSIFFQNYVYIFLKIFHDSPIFKGCCNFERNYKDSQFE